MLESRLSKKCRKSGYKVLKVHLVKMVQAASEQMFDKTIQAASSLFETQMSRIRQLERYLTEFDSVRETHASHCHA